jgi:hypothetical protein
LLGNIAEGQKKRCIAYVDEEEEEKKKKKVLSR